MAAISRTRATSTFQRHDPPRRTPLPADLQPPALHGVDPRQADPGQLGGVPSEFLKVMPVEYRRAQEMGRSRMRIAPRVISPLSQRCDMLLAYAAMEVSMNEHEGTSQRMARLKSPFFKNGRSRAVRIPKEIEFDGAKAILVKQPDGSIMMRTAVTAGLIDYQRAEPWESADFAADNDDLAELPEVDL